MTNTKPVVVGIEGDQPLALRFAAETARTRGVGLRVVHCVDPQVAGEFSVVSDGVRPVPGEEVLDRARGFLAGLLPDSAVEYVLSVRGPHGELYDEAERGSLIVVGTDPAARIDRVFSGHVTERLIKHADVPVAVVPEDRSPSDSKGTVFLAVDAKGPANGPLRFAFEEAQRRDRRLHVAHVAPAGAGPDDIEVLRAEVSEILAGWTGEYPEVIVARWLIFDEPDTGVLRASAEADVLVLGRSNSTSIPRPFAHRVLTEIARHTHCPTVIVPDEWPGN
jgi:nucleotide-binding universal stress UspA family protein